MTTNAKKLVLLLGVVLTLWGAAPAGAQPAEPYQSPQRAMCEEELKKDAGWYAELKLQLKDDVHAEESATFTRNNRHVVIAYAAIWVLTIGFVVFLWMRQQALKTELARLSSELARAAKDE